MPLFYTKEENHYQIAIWKMEEDVEELLEVSDLRKSDLVRVDSFTHEARKKEWICIRLLLKELGHDWSIGYLPTGKPFLENSSWHISISHTKDYAGLILSKDHVVGLDLERILPRIEKIANKFVSDKEERLVEEPNRMEKLFVIWGIKEVLFKMHSLGELNFKENLRVHGFSYRLPGKATATLEKAEFIKTYALDFESKGDLLITWCIDERWS